MQTVSGPRSIEPVQPSTITQPLVALRLEGIGGGIDWIAKGCEKQAPAEPEAWLYPSLPSAIVPGCW